MKYFDKFHPDKYYHIFNHAVGKENLFHSHDNYLFFLARYSTFLSPILKTYCYCLMPNHFHLLIQIRDDETIRKLAGNNFTPTFDHHKFLMQQMSNFLNSYTKAFNKQNNRKGSLFIDFTKRKEIENESYFTSVVNYIHQNAVYHGFCDSAQDWPYSSYNSILKTGKATQLERNLIFDWFGGIEKFIDFHQNYEGTITEITIEN